MLWYQPTFVFWCGCKIVDYVMHQSFEPPSPPPPACPGESGEHSPVCVSLGGGVNTRFHFFVAWFSDGSKSSGGVSERTTSSRLKIRRTSTQMSRGFTFNLSVDTFLHCLVIWTFDMLFLCSLRSCFLTCPVTSLAFTHTEWMSLSCPGWLGVGGEGRGGA